MEILRRLSPLVLLLVAAIPVWGSECESLQSVPGATCAKSAEYPQMVHYSKAVHDSRELWKKLANINRPPFDRSIALLVGVASYQNKGFASLPFVYNDIREMRNYLLNEEEFSDVYIVLDRDVDANALKGLVVNIFAAKLVGPDDRFLFYYSGHGSAEGDGNGHMLLWGATPGTFAPEWDVPVSEVRGWSSWLQNKHVLFLLDGCGLGLGLAGVSKFAPGDRFSAISNNGSRIALAATRGAENSFGTKDNQRSVFTAEFLSVLRSGNADPSHYGFSTIDAVSALMQPGLADAIVGTSMASTFKTVFPLNLDSSRTGTFIFINQKHATELIGPPGPSPSPVPLPPKGDVPSQKPGPDLFPKAACVYDPVSNVRQSPSTTSDIVCAIDTVRMIRITGAPINTNPKYPWWPTDACGQPGFIANNQVHLGAATCP